MGSIWTPGAEIPLPEKREQRAAREEDLRPLVDMGLFETGAHFRFRCAVCGNTVTNDQRMEPVCTGPSWTDDHPHTLMALIA